MAKTKGSKKVNVKAEAKAKLNKEFTELLDRAGISWEPGEDFGFSAGTIVVHMEGTDVQAKFITPKAGVNRYEKPKDEEGEVEE